MKKLAKQNDRQELKLLLESREWRLNNLYWIEDKQGKLCRLKCNWAQLRLVALLHTRNEILKARQLGISTLVAILMLDSCLFKTHFACGIVDKNVDDAKKKLQKAYLAYDMLDYVPDVGETPRDHALAAIGKAIKARVKFSKRDVTFAEWRNGSSIRVGASMRGGSLQFLHVSELAYVANHNPIRAMEIKTGALQAVSKAAHIIKESTHEGGRSGINYEMVAQAMANQRLAKLSPLDYKFFFFSWWQEPSYELDAEYWTRPLDPMSPSYQEDCIERRQLEEYFEGMAEHPYIKCLPLGEFVLTDRKKAWYASKARELGFTVKQEYPSTPDEAFDVMAQRAIYANALMILRANACLSASFQVEPYSPFYVSWDLGYSDAMSIWLFQHGCDGKYYVIDHYSASRKDISHFQAIARAWEATHDMTIERHFLPHDARNHKHDGSSFESDMRLSGFKVDVVPRVSDLWNGINAVRKLLPQCVIHERCGNPVIVDGKEYPSGLQCLENYQTAPDGMNGIVRNTPLHDRYSHSADAFRCFAEAQKAGLVGRNHFGDAGTSAGAGGRALGADWL